MPEESTTPDLVELGRRIHEAVNRREFDLLKSVYAPDAVVDAEGLGTFGAEPRFVASSKTWWAAKAAPDG